MNRFLRKIGVEGHADVANQQSSLRSDRQSMGVYLQQSITRHGLQGRQNGREMLMEVEIELPVQCVKIQAKVADQAGDDVAAQ